MQSTVTTSLDGLDEGASIVEFYDGKLFMNDEDRELAIAEGRLTPEAPDYRTVTFIKIKFPGRSDLVVDRPAYMEGGGDFLPDMVRYPVAWANYKGKGEPVTGTPLTALKALNEGDVAHLEGKGIRTVELLEGMSDTQIMATGMGMRRYRDIARAYMAEQPSRDPAAQAELDTLRAELAELRALIPQAKPRREKEAAHG